MKQSRLGETMSDYLVKRILSSKSITVLSKTTVEAVEGSDSLQNVTLLNRETQQLTQLSICHLFLMLGAKPNVSWLPKLIARDSNGFLLTGNDVLKAKTWPLAERLLEPLESNLPGIFAVGDVRSGSVKRVASAVGEGANCVSSLHRVIANLHLKVEE